MENTLKDTRCAVSGHRPFRSRLNANLIKPLISRAIEQSIEDGYVTFITGMAMGFDIYAGLEIVEIKKKNPDIHLVCAVPYKSMEDRWTYEWKTKYQTILEASDFTKYISDSFNRDIYKMRNAWMAARVSRLIAECDGVPGGTMDMIHRCEANGVEIYSIFQ